MHRFQLSEATENLLRFIQKHRQDIELIPAYLIEARVRELLAQYDELFAALPTVQWPEPASQRTYFAKLKEVRDLVYAIRDIVGEPELGIDEDDPAWEDLYEAEPLYPCRCLAVAFDMFMSDFGGALKARLGPEAKLAAATFHPRWLFDDEE